MTRYVRVFAAIGVLHAAGCVLGGADDDDSEDTSEVELQPPGNPQQINIGFDSGTTQFGVEQFKFYPVFFNASSIHPGPRICHTYVNWKLGNEAPAMGVGLSPAGHRAAFEYWLSHAQSEGHCEEVLVSFQDKCPNGCDPPSIDDMRTAFENFLNANWVGETGYTGTFAFTPWNEPNNPGDAGNGTGKVIPPETAAQYYLMEANHCATHNCKVAAGDFASNGSWPKDFEWNCANDNIQNLTTTHADGTRYCRHPSSKNAGNSLPASYLDRYKNYIALHSHEYPNLESRPKYFAFHSWHDVNEYLNNNAHCTSYDDCVTRRLLKALGGSWSGVVLWDTETGASQGEDVSDPHQACTAAFLLRATALNARIQRIYYTRLYNGGAGHGGELISGSDPATATGRPSLTVLANRTTNYTPPNGSCQ